MSFDDFCLTRAVDSSSFIFGFSVEKDNRRAGDESVDVEDNEEEDN